jgi:hypothetical protein
MATPWQNANWNSFTFNGEDGKPVYVSVTPHCSHCNQNRRKKRGHNATINTANAQHTLAILNGGVQVERVLHGNARLLI